MFPIGDDNPTRRTPFVTISLIVANVLVFVSVNVGSGSGEALREFWETWAYHEDAPLSAQVITYQFLHGDWLHILNNLWMLWIVGDNVEDKLGHGRYLACYLFAGVVAAWVYSAVGQMAGPGTQAALDPGVLAPSLLVGASGSIFGIMGMYFVLFPEARIRILFWFFLLVQVIRVRAKWVIGIWLGIEIFRTLGARGPAVGQVATAAHVGGGLCGLLIARWLKPRIGGGGDGDAWDVHTGFSNSSRSSSTEALFNRDSRHDWFQSHQPPETTLLDLEDRLIDFVKSGRMREAIDIYPRYEAMPRERPLPGAIQLEIAHEYYEQGLHRDALDAYRRYLETESSGADRGEAKFRIGVLLNRWLGRPEEARPFLADAAREHPDPRIRKFAADEMMRR